MNKIYITDLDYTLLDSRAQLSERTLRGLKKPNENNIDFTVASARSIKSMQTILSGATFKLPVIEFNGAFISHFNNGEHIVVNSIKRDIVDMIINYTESIGLDIFYSTFNGKKDLLYFPEITNSGQEWYYSDRIKDQDPRIQEDKYIFSREGTDSIVCLTYIDSFENLRPLEEYLINCPFSKDMSIHFYENDYSKDWRWLTIHSSRSQKHLAIRELLAITNKEDHEVIVFGDASNDASMFETADRSYAV
ncbi:MAG: Cof-type HAD-IIB family hydrolase, partial [Actinomycetia bacterium]|nr:Cof-type HAD-IIB family hydrolase [Actinomycetes bacterium]